MIAHHSSVHRRPVPGGYGVSARRCRAASVGVSPGYERRRGYLSV